MNWQFHKAWICKNWIIYRKYTDNVGHVFVLMCNGNIVGEYKTIQETQQAADGDRRTQIAYLREWEDREIDKSIPKKED